MKAFWLGLAACLALAGGASAQPTLALGTGGGVDSIPLIATGQTESIRDLKEKGVAF